MFHDLSQQQAIRESGAEVTEDQEQAWVIQWARRNSDNHPELILLFHTPNGGHRSKRQGALLKLTGVRAGVPDLFLPVARGGYHGLFIEMKVADRKKGRVSKEQKQWIDDLITQGYDAKVCYGFEEARGAIVAYLGLNE